MQEILGPIKKKDTLRLLVLCSVLRRTEFTLVRILYCNSSAYCVAVAEFACLLLGVAAAEPPISWQTTDLQPL